MGEDAVLERYPVIVASDPDLVHDAAVQLMSEHRMRLPSQTRSMRATIRSAPLQRTGLVYFEYGVPAEISSAPIEGYSTVHLPLAGAIELEADGVQHRVGPGTGLVFSHGRPVRMRWSADLRLLVARFDHDALLERLRSMLGVEVAEPLVFDSVLVAEGGADSTARLILATERMLADSGNMLSPVVVRQLEDAAMSALLLTHGHTSRERLAAPVSLPSPRTIRAAVAAIDARFDQEVTSADLAATAGVSERALHAAFQRRFGTSPMRYLRDHRYAIAHQRLRQGAASTVAEVAHGVGLHHLGRFSSDYRDRFGETPATTLRRAIGEPEEDR